MTAKSLKHKFVSAVVDGTDATLTRPSNWNDEHNFTLGYRSVTIATDALADADTFSLIVYNNAGGVAVSLPAPSSGLFALGWYARLQNAGLGTVTVTPGSTINGSATAITLAQGDALDLHGTGTADFRGVKIPAPVAAPSQQALGGILTFVSATQLKFAPYGGNYFKLNGVFRLIPVAGIAGLGNTGVFVNGVAGQNLAANTVYWIFAFDNAGVVTADFRTAATHTQSATVGNEGTEILTGNDTRSLIGMCRTTATSQFSASGKQQFVLSWFNRKQIFSTLTDTLTDRLVVTGTTPTEVTPPGRIEFLCWAGAARAWCYGPTGGNPGDAIISDVRFDGSVALGSKVVATLSAGWSFNPSATNIQNLSEGYHYASLWLNAFGATTNAMIYGATYGVPLVINAEVWG